jgi:hypothetical protein
VQRTVIESLEGSELISVGLYQVSKLVEEDAAARTGGVQAPDGVEGILGSLDGGIHILWGGFRDGGDDLSVG